MSKTINVKVRERRATNVSDGVYVCGNGDYTIEFEFDAEWSAYETKTTRFTYGGVHQDVVFPGNICPMPKIGNAHVIYVGVYAGELYCTTEARVYALKSCLSDEGTPAEPTEDVYGQIMERLNELGEADPETIRQAVEDYLTENMPDTVDRTEMQTYVDDAISANNADVDAKLEEKADKTTMAADLEGKADKTTMAAALEAKADKTAVETLSAEMTAQLNDKADAAEVASALADKADKTAVDTALADKVDAATLEESIADYLTQNPPEADVTEEKVTEALGYAPVKDVLVAGSSVLADGVASIPFATHNGPAGVISLVSAQESGLYMNGLGQLGVSHATDAEIDARHGIRKTITCSNLDYALKKAMCDGKGATWSESEQQAARERMGVTTIKGDKGDKGDTPVKGVDYYTDADKAEMVQAVLDALPAAEGVSY